MTIKVLSTRVLAPNSQSDVVNASPTNGINDASHQTQTETCVADDKKIIVC